MTASTITHLLEDWRAGKSEALSRIMPLMYDELRDAASGGLRREYRSRTLEPTELLHEAYLALVRGAPAACGSRSHFKAIFHRVMRQILVQRSRRRTALKRGGAETEITLRDEHALQPPESGRMDVETALQELRRRAPRAHLVVEMYYRGGYSPAEIADTMLVSARTVERELSVGRAWLQRQLAPASA